MATLLSIVGIINDACKLYQLRMLWLQATETQFYGILNK